MPTTPPVLAEAGEAFEELVKTIRPKLHRYGARMTGSVVEAEDVVQDALATAYIHLGTTGAATTIEIVNLEGWLFRIVHNKAIDYLRLTKRTPIEFVDAYPTETNIAQPLLTEELTTFALSIYLRLTPMQRSSVILKDVIGYSLVEISEILDVSVGAVKAALHRGRDNLRSLAESVQDDTPQALDDREMSLLSQYVAHFNARDFEAVRAMLADDVRLDLVRRVKKKSKSEVGRYFAKYDEVDGWLLTVGLLESNPVILVSELDDRERFNYIILIRWQQENVCEIRDYRYVPFVMEDAKVAVFGDGR